MKPAKKTVDYDVFITNDGKEFTIKSQAEDHEKFLNGTRKKCSACDGRGRINYREEGYRDTWNMIEGRHEVSDPCHECHGKGYLEKKVTWE